MDRTPGGGPSDSIHHYDFSTDEIEVAVTLTRLNFLIPLYDSLNFGFLPPLWGSKRLRSACSSDHQRTESVVVIACPVISCGDNLGNISPDSPLLLKASSTSGGGVQGSPGIVVEPPREKEVTNKNECKDDIDDSAGSKNNPPKEKTEIRNFNIERTESEELPANGDAHASSSSPLMFDLNLTPPDCSGIQSPLPNEDGTPRLPPSDGMLTLTSVPRDYNFLGGE